MNIFQPFFTYFMWQPQINVLRLTYQITQDMGYSIILMAIVLNIPIIYVYAKSFLSLQKQRSLAPKMRAIQIKYKDDPMEMRKQLVGFNKKHGIDSSGLFFTIIFQIVILAGLYSLIQEIGTKQSNYLYSWAWGSDVFTFPTKIFNGPKLNDSVHGYLWITVLTSLNAYMQGLATFKWFPQIKLKPAPDQTEEQIQQAEAMEKSQSFLIMYFTPIMYLVINYSLPLGLGIYNLVSTSLTLLRLVAVSFYFRNHTKELIKQMDETDPDESDVYVVDVDGKAITSRDETDNVVDVESKIKPKKIVTAKAGKNRKKK
jgi:YidC/Oxa1 family membrane protein insertase